MAQPEFSSLGQCFAFRVEQSPDRVALLQPNPAGLRSYTWREVAVCVARLASLLQARGLQAGQHVASYLENSLAWIATDLAAQQLGLVHVALDPRLPPLTASELWVHSQSRCIVTTASRAPALEQACPPRQTRGAEQPADTPPQQTRSSGDASQHNGHQASSAVIVIPLWDEGLSLPYTPPHDFSWSPESEQPAQILYTSGTCGSPRGVVLSHGNLLSNARAKLIAAPQSADDVRLNILSFSHAYARTCELSTWLLTGGQLAIASDWTEFLAWAPRLEPTLINLVPQLVSRLWNQLQESASSVGGGSDVPDALPVNCTVSDASASADASASVGGLRWQDMLGSRLRLLQVGGAALSPAIWNGLAAQGLPPLQGYGLTEASPVVCSNLAGSQRSGSVGPPVAEAEVRIDVHGTLWTRGPHVMQGYWRDPAATHERIRDGWLDTGDVAQWTSDGHIQILGRRDDMLVLSSGYKVAPDALQRRLENDPWISQILIVGRSRPYASALVWPQLGELPAALFRGPQSLENLNQEALRQALIQRWQSLQADLPRAVRIELVGLLPEPLTVENGCLNFKGAPRRAFAERYFAAAIDRLYA
jgi:long-chain acyl-CoA synthetase